MGYLAKFEGSIPLGEGVLWNQIHLVNVLILRVALGKLPSYLVGPLCPLSRVNRNCLRTWMGYIWSLFFILKPGLNI